MRQREIRSESRMENCVRIRHLRMTPVVIENDDIDTVFFGVCDFCNGTDAGIDCEEECHALCCEIIDNRIPQPVAIADAVGQAHEWLNPPSPQTTREKGSTGN